VTPPRVSQLPYRWDRGEMASSLQLLKRYSSPSRPAAQLYQAGKPRRLGRYAAAGSALSIGDDMRTYRLVLAVEVSAHDMVEAGMLVGKYLADIADDMEITEFEEVER